VIAKEHRFHGHNSVNRVRGSKIHAADLSIYYSFTKRDSYRLAIVVSKKTAKSAVTRNRIRRRIYETVRKFRLLDGLSVDVVCVVRNENIATISQEALLLQVEATFKQIPKSK
jgi:ribonuclease P protein component